jgi:hypothetical protein
MMLFSKGQSGEASETSKQIIEFRKSEALERKLLSFHLAKNMKMSMRQLWNSIYSVHQFSVAIFIIMLRLSEIQ